MKFFFFLKVKIIKGVYCYHGSQAFKKRTRGYAQRTPTTLLRDAK